MGQCAKGVTAQTLNTKSEFSQESPACQTKTKDTSKQIDSQNLKNLREKEFETGRALQRQTQIHHKREQNEANPNDNQQNAVLSDISNIKAKEYNKESPLKKQNQEEESVEIQHKPISKIKLPQLSDKQRQAAEKLDAMMRQNGSALLTKYEKVSSLLEQRA